MLKQTGGHHTGAHPDAAKTLRSFLLEADLADDLSFSQFVAFFPAKYQNSKPSLKRIFEDFQNSRRRVRKKVAHNINSTFGPCEEDGGPIGDLKGAIGRLKEQENSLYDMLKERKRALRDFKGQLSQFEDKLEEQQREVAAGGVPARSLHKQDLFEVRECALLLSRDIK